MKRKLIFLAACIFMTNAVAFQVINIKPASFAPVAWHLDREHGGYFDIKNDTHNIEYVQITVNSGRVNTYTRTTHGTMECKKDLEGNNNAYPYHSAVCELAPSDILAVNLDMSQDMDANGAYQIEMKQ
jgi:hypothetical protein